MEFSIKVALPRFTTSVTSIEDRRIRYLSTTEALELLKSRGLKISRPTLISMAKRGKLEYLRKSKNKLRFEIGDLIKLIERKNDSEYR